MSTITREHVTHNLKIWPEYFAAVRDGLKRAELRWNDREYHAGDTLDLCEWDPNEEAFTGDFISVTVTHVAELGQWMPGYVLLSFAPPAPVSVPTFEEWCERTEQKPIGWVRDAMKEAYDACRTAMLQGAEQTNYRGIVERIAEIVHGKVTDIDLLTVTVKSMKDKLHK